MKISIGCDEAAYDFKEIIKMHLIERGYEVNDHGVRNSKEKVLYPDVAYSVANSVKNKESDTGILLCGTGIGMSITANKVPGIRAAVCHDIYSAERSKKSNDVQIMCMGARVIAPELGVLLVDSWLESEFIDGRSTEKVKRITEIEKIAISE